METHVIKKHSKRISDEFTHLLLTSEKEKGLLLSYDEFRKGNMIKASKAEQLTLLTTMLLGSGTFFYNYLKSTYPDFSAAVVKPNGFTSTFFEVKYSFGGNEVLVLRTMDNKKLLFNPFAAENPKNYNLIYAFNIKEERELTELMHVLTQYLEQNSLKYEISARD